MRINYNILWVENDLEWLEPNREYACDIIEEEGFKCVVNVATSIEEVDALLAHEKPFKDYDLILIDLQLNHGERGNVIIDQIRRHNIYTDVIFYSQDIVELRQRVKDHHLDGVYCASRNRNEFADKFEKVFHSTIKKLQDISTIRGLVLSEASQLDDSLREITINFTQKRPNDEQDLIRNYILNDLLPDAQKSNTKLEKDLKGLANVDLVSHPFLDSYKRMRVVGRIIEVLKDSRLPTKAEFCKGYNDDIIAIRNSLAHCIEGEKDGMKFLITRKGDEVFDDDRCKKIRESIRQQGKRISEISALI